MANANANINSSKDETPIPVKILDEKFTPYNKADYLARRKATIKVV